MCSPLRAHLVTLSPEGDEDEETSVRMSWNEGPGRESRLENIAHMSGNVTPASNGRDVFRGLSGF